MKTPEFYDIFDKKLLEIIDEYKNKDENIKKHSKNIHIQKSYAFLIWFLKFYANKPIYNDYITEGDGDSSCDIIFDNFNEREERIYYVVQSKWNIKKNISGKISSKDIKHSLNDFKTILGGDKKNSNNVKFNEKSSELLEHRRKNGKVKFIFLTLSNTTEKADDNIKDFEKNNDKAKVEIIDINRIKKDFIDRYYKEIEIKNLLEFSEYTLEEDTITLKVERLKSTCNRIKIEKPFDAGIFLIRPGEIHRLFKKYGLTLFFKNVRNPLLKSDFNKQIKETMINNPQYFWYYNNGISAITDDLPNVVCEAEEFQVEGFQIINGAQTVYAVYSAYEESSIKKRKQLDRDALITLRLVKSGGKDFNLQITRFTNSQNPVSDRDFYANDNIQTEIQNYFYNSNFWYEKRRDEFRKIPENIKIIKNELAAEAYLAFHLQDPINVIRNFEIRKYQNGKNLMFISHKQDKYGIYEKIFENMKPKDMLASCYIFDILRGFREFNNPKIFENIFFQTLALFKIVFSKYMRLKNLNKNPINQYIIYICEKKNIDIIVKTVRFTVEVLLNKYDSEKRGKKFINMITTSTGYEQMKDYFEEELEINIEDIENKKFR